MTRESKIWAVIVLAQFVRNIPASTHKELKRDYVFKLQFHYKVIYNLGAFWSSMSKWITS